MFETIVSIGLPLVEQVIKMIQDAAAAKAEAHAEIVARMQAAAAALAGDRDAAHAALDQLVREVETAKFPPA